MQLNNRDFIALSLQWILQRHTQPALGRPLVHHCGVRRGGAWRGRVAKNGVFRCACREAPYPVESPERVLGVR